MSSEGKSPFDSRKSIDAVSINSSFIHESLGIPLRIHGKVKYAQEIETVKKRMRTYIILRSIVAAASVIIL